MKVERVRVGEFPNFKLQVSDFQKIGQSVVGAILENIAKQVQADGAPLKKNADSTWWRKFNARKKPLSLVGGSPEKRFSARSSFVIEPDREGVTVYPKDQEVTRYVQQKGYTGWLGVSRKRLEKIANIIRTAIKRERRRAKV